MAWDAALEETLESITADRDARDLLFHRRNELLFVEGSDMFYNCPATGTTRRMRGLLPLLRECFWPDETHAAILQAAKTRDKKLAAEKTRILRRANSSSSSSRSRNFPGRHPGMGKAKGARAHAQIQAAMLVDHTSFQNMFGRMVPSARRVLNYIVNVRNWLPLRPEVPVYDETLNVCARIDIVAAKPDGTLVFIEVKTGSRHCFESHGGVDMEGPLRGVLVDSELNRAMVQLAASILIALRGHTRVQRIEGYVVHALDDEEGDGSTKGLRAYPLSATLIATHGGAIYQAMKRIACAPPRPMRPPW